MKPVTGSALARTDQCPASALAPAVHQVVDSHAAERGVALHAYLANVNLMGREKALQLVPSAWQEDAAVIDLARLPVNPESYAAEVALAYNWAGDFTEPLRSRDEYSTLDPKLWLFGTLDVLGLTEDAAVVFDFKTGRRWLGKPTDAAQLRAYGLFAARAFERKRAVIGFIRLDENGTPWFSTEVLEAADLDAEAAHLSELMTRVLELNEVALTANDVREGAECRWCPAFARCPAKVALAHAISAESAANPPIIPQLTPENAVQALLRLTDIETIAKLVESSLREFVKVSGPLKLPNGRFWGPVDRRNTEVLDVDKAVAVVTQLVGPERASRCVERSFSLGTMEDAVGGYLQDTTGKVRGKTKVVDELRGSLEKAGAIKVTTVKQFREHTPKLALVADVAVKPEEA